MEINSKNWWIIGGIVIVLILGFVWWQNKPAVTPAGDGATLNKEAILPATENTGETVVTKPVATKLPSITKDGIYLIYYTSKGFVPSALEIPAGKSVRLINNSGGKAMRIGSTDTTNSPIYNSFNQSKTVGAGGTYEYTFVDKGVFTYSNKNNPGDQGSITVR